MKDKRSHQFYPAFTGLPIKTSSVSRTKSTRCPSSTLCNPWWLSFSSSCSQTIECSEGQQCYSSTTDKRNMQNWHDTSEKDRAMQRGGLAKRDFNIRTDKSATILPLRNFTSFDFFWRAGRRTALPGRTSEPPGPQGHGNEKVCLLYLVLK